MFRPTVVFFSGGGSDEMKIPRFAHIQLFYGSFLVNMHIELLGRMQNLIMSKNWEK